MATAYLEMPYINPDQDFVGIRDQKTDQVCLLNNKAIRAVLLQRALDDVKEKQFILRSAIRCFYEEYPNVPGVRRFIVKAKQWETLAINTMKFLHDYGIPTPVLTTIFQESFGKCEDGEFISINDRQVYGILDQMKLSQSLALHTIDELGEDFIEDDESIT